MTNPKSLRGGTRTGAGRKSAYGEPTRIVRIPESQIPELNHWLENYRMRLKQRQPLPGDVLGKHIRPLAMETAPFQVPMLGRNVPAGFPSPADDFLQNSIDLNQHLIQHREATFVLRVSGSSMINAGIWDGDELIVDRALPPQDGKVVIAVVDGELTVKRLHIHPKGVRLCAANPDYPDLEIAEGQELQIWGVVTRVLHKV